MELGNRGGRARCLVVWSCATSAAIGAWCVTGPSARAGACALFQHRLDAVPLDRALAQLAAAVLLGCAGWLWLGTSYVVLEAARGGPRGRDRDRQPRGRAHARGRDHGPARGWVPAGLRRLVLAACGTAIVGSLAQPPVAATVGVAHPRQRPQALVGSPLAGLPLPERATVEPRSRSVPHRSREWRAPTVMVAPGDTLWSIAAQTLPAQSPDAVVARRWRDIYAANRSRIGPDPDLIVPGRRLRLPRKDLP